MKSKEQVAEDLEWFIRNTTKAISDEKMELPDEFYEQLGQGFTERAPTLRAFYISIGLEEQFKRKCVALSDLLFKRAGVLKQEVEHIINRTGLPRMMN